MKKISFKQPIVMLGFMSIVGLVIFLYTRQNIQSSKTAVPTTIADEVVSQTDDIDLNSFYEALNTAQYESGDFTLEYADTTDARVYLKAEEGEILEFEENNNQLNFNLNLHTDESENSEVVIFDSTEISNAIEQVGREFTDYLVRRGFSYFSGSEVIEYQSGEQMLKRGDTYCFHSYYEGGILNAVHSIGCVDVTQEQFNGEYARIKPFYDAAKNAFDGFDGVLSLGEARIVSSYELVRGSLGGLTEDNGFYAPAGGGRISFYRITGSNEWTVGPGGGHSADNCSEYDLEAEQTVYADDVCYPDDNGIAETTTVKEFWR